MMPRFIFETRALSEAEGDAAFHVATSRFPEIRIEHRYTGRDPNNHETWVCSAPSRSHITRWTALVEIDLDALEQVDDKPNTPLATRRAPNSKEISE
jgi:hypothetical protein